MRWLGGLFIVVLMGVGALSLRANWAVWRYGGDNDYTQSLIRQALGATAVFLTGMEILLLVEGKLLDCVLLPLLAVVVFVLARIKWGRD